MSSVAWLKTSHRTSVGIRGKYSYVVPWVLPIFRPVHYFQWWRRLFSRKLFYDCRSYTIVARHLELWFGWVYIRSSKQDGWFWFWCDFSPGPACPSLPALTVSSRPMIPWRPWLMPLILPSSAFSDDLSDIFFLFHQDQCAHPYQRWQWVHGQGYRGGRDWCRWFYRVQLFLTTYQISFAHYFSTFFSLWKFFKVTNWPGEIDYRECLVASY